MMFLGALESTQDAKIIEMDKSLGINLHFGAFADTVDTKTTLPT